MATTVNYDIDEHLFSPSSDAVCQFLNEAVSPDFFVLSTTDIQTDIDLSQNSSNSSPAQLTSFSSTLSTADLAANSAKNEFIDFSLMTKSSEKLRIIAEPKAYYRERYCSETDPNKHRAQRFIRAGDDDTSTHEYPTVEIPLKWRNPTRDFYIRVTLVTIFADKVPVVCIHPYGIDTPEDNVLQDSHNNSLYFRITKDEILNGQKSFRITRKKMIQYDLRSYGPLRLFDLNQNDIQRTMNTHDAKQIIDTYQLWKSQLVFTIAERFNNISLPIPISLTSVTSQIMCDAASGRRKDPVITDTIYTAMYDDDTITCAPRKGDWCGGDQIIMIIPKLDKRKVCNLYFDYGLMGRMGDIPISYGDSKTIYFQTPPCPILIAEKNFLVPIIVTQNDLIIARVNFIYLAPIKTTINLCSRCQIDMMNEHNRSNNKRRHLLLEACEYDQGESLIEQMKNLTTEEKTTKAESRFINEEANSKFDKYLNQLQDAMIEFVRTNNPSRLFRRTRLLLAKCTENPQPIDDAIRHGHIDLASKLIEQVIDMPTANGLLERENNEGETPLLLAAKFNHWILIEPILQKRPDLIQKTDKFNNNILHLLANITKDKSTETMKNMLELLPNDIKTNLIKAKNKDNQTPIEIAQIRNNTQCVDLIKNCIKSTIDSEKT